MSADKIAWRTWLLAPVVLARFLPFYFWEMTRANLKVAGDALRPKPNFSPGFIDIDLAGYTPVQCWAAVCLISMTPGTLSLDLPDGSTKLSIHVLYMESEDAVKTELYRLLHKALGNPQQ